jgi:hypothetical protein
MQRQKRASAMHLISPANWALHATKQQTYGISENS